MRRLGIAVFRVVLGLTLGLVIAEAAFRFRDDGAFPHVNVYLPDETLGTRLEPLASQRLAFTGNPATSLRINSKGFRGGEWPDPKQGELIVVGDSQVFGLGVEEDETFPAQLAKQSGRQVLNAGVPTYGPREYLAVAKNLVSERREANVVLVFNVANDFFELDRPNVKRHAVWDGWAVRKENKPAIVEDFPLRHWLFSQSHLVFAIRKLQLERQQTRGDSEALVNFAPPKDGDDRGTASEGSWTDLLTVQERQEKRLAEEKTRANREETETKQRMLPLRQQVEDEQVKVQRLEEDLGAAPNYRLRRESVVDEILTKQPGDIVRDMGSEMARSIPVTAELLVEAAAEKKRLAGARARLEKERAPHDEVIRKSHAELEALRWAIPAVSRELPTLGEDFLDELVAFQKAHGEVTVVVLPLDVQVSKGEWAKYGAPDKDLTDTLELNRAFTAAAQRRGLRAIDVVPSLQKAEPGAFLLGDLHMTTKGIGAVAGFVAEALKQPPPETKQAASWPPGVTPLPSPVEWNAVAENTVKGSTAAGCETKQVREWLRVRCTNPPGGGVYRGVGWVEGRRGELQLTSVFQRAAAIVPVRPGQVTRVAFRFENENGDQFERVLRAEWTKDAPVLEFEKDVAERATTKWVPQASQVLVTCNDTYSGSEAVPWGNLEPGSPCHQYSDCQHKLACAQGHPNAKPECPDGQVNAGADFRCLRVCTEDASCDGAFGPGTKGMCRAWQSARVCF